MGCMALGIGLVYWCMAWGTSDYEACWQMCFPQRAAVSDRVHGAATEAPQFMSLPSRA